MQLVEKAHHAYGTRSTCFGWQRVTLSALQILPLNAGVVAMNSTQETTLPCYYSQNEASCLEFFGLAIILIWI